MSDPPESSSMSRASQANEECSEKEEEVRWVDASIRWEDHKDKGDLEDDSDDLPDDPFRDSDPTDTFLLKFSSPVSTTNNADEENVMSEIVIKLKGYKADSDQVWNSTGLTLWRAAKHLCNYLLKEAALLQSKRTLELGAGLGLCGLLASRLDAQNTVCLTDGDIDAMEQLRYNAALNGLSKQVKCRQLIWGREAALEFLQRYASGQKFDILLASDVVYVANIIRPLWETVQVLLEQDGLFLFAYCSRRLVPVSIEAVLEGAEEFGFTNECVEDSDGVMIYIFRWRNELPA